MEFDMGMACPVAHSRHLLSPLHRHPPLRVSILIHSSHHNLTSPHRPESPRWLVHNGLYDEARLVVAQCNSNGDLADPVAIAQYKEIVDTLEYEKGAGQTMSPVQMFRTKTNLRRLFIGSSPGLFSCAAGNM
jgi:hypothetical protein